MERVYAAGRVLCSSGGAGSPLFGQHDLLLLHLVNGILLFWRARFVPPMRVLLQYQEGLFSPLAQPSVSPPATRCPATSRFPPVPVHQPGLGPAAPRNRPGQTALLSHASLFALSCALGPESRPAQRRDPILMICRGQLYASSAHDRV